MTTIHTWDSDSEKSILSSHLSDSFQVGFKEYYFYSICYWVMDFLLFDGLF